MLDYMAGAQHHWERVNVGKHSTNIKKLLLPEPIQYYDALMNSYIPADEAQILLALEMLMSKYDTLAASVAKTLNYEYDSEEAAKTMRFVQARLRIDGE